MNGMKVYFEVSDKEAKTSNMQQKWSVCMVGITYADFLSANHGTNALERILLYKTVVEEDIIAKN